MDFISFARLHGIVIDHEPQIGLWRRYATEDKPTHKNGSVKFMGDHAFIQNHAVMTEIAVWKADADAKIDYAKIRRIAQKADDDIKRKQAEAARTAAWMLKESQFAHHPYLAKKGFAEDQANVFFRDGLKIMAIPMRVGHHLVGCQLIDENGEKKFLAGQRTSNATFTFDNKGDHILVEGYATALSARVALKALKKRYTLHVCFSAGNLAKVAATLPKGFVICDNDASRTGENTAIKTGFPYWMSDTVGEDFNDFHQRVGLFKASQSLGKVIR